jgi:hypothetical protein
MSAVNAQAMEILIESAGLAPRQLPASPILLQRQAELAQIIQDWGSPLVQEVFAPSFFLDKSLHDRAEDARGLLAQTGPISAVGSLAPVNQLRGTFSLLGTKGRIDVFFTLTPENTPRVQALTLTYVPKLAASPGPDSR